MPSYLEIALRVASAAQPAADKVHSPETIAGLKNWPPESLEVERRFAQPHTRLFPFLGRKVRTPGGPGTLIQVFSTRVTVLLDSELSRCAFFEPDQIEPVSWRQEDSPAQVRGGL